MKFYKYKNSINFYNKIKINKLTSIYFYITNSSNKSYYGILFFKDGKEHNDKNAAYIRSDEYRLFYLNNKNYGNQKDFTKKSWRRFVKLQVFI